MYAKIALLTLFLGALVGMISIFVNCVSLCNIWKDWKKKLFSAKNNFSKSLATGYLIGVAIIIPALIYFIVVDLPGMKSEKDSSQDASVNNTIENDSRDEIFQLTDESTTSNESVSKEGKTDNDHHSHNNNNKEENSGQTTPQNENGTNQEVTQNEIGTDSQSEASGSESNTATWYEFSERYGTGASRNKSSSTSSSSVIINPSSEPGAKETTPKPQNTGDKSGISPNGNTTASQGNDSDVDLSHGDEPDEGSTGASPNDESGTDLSHGDEPDEGSTGASPKDESGTDLSHGDEPDEGGTGASPNDESGTDLSHGDNPDEGSTGTSPNDESGSGLSPGDDPSDNNTDSSKGESVHDPVDSNNTSYENSILKMDNFIDAPAWLVKKYFEEELHIS